MELEVLVDLSTPATIVLNVGTVSLWAWSIVDAVRTPRHRWARPQGKVLTVLALMFVSVVVTGVLVPIASLLWAAWFRPRLTGDDGHKVGRGTSAGAPVAADS